MNKQLKEILKAVLIVITAITVIFLLIMFSSDDKENNNDFTDYLKNTNYPIESYYFSSDKTADKKYQITDKGVEKKEDEKTNNEAKLESKIAKLKKELEEKQTKYKLGDVFKSDEQIQEELEEQRRKKILNSRMNGFVQPQNSISVNDDNLQPDYGASSFSNFNAKDKASNETKLYRSITADNMIPIVLVNPIDTSLAGKVVAKVEDDIFASMGRALLIPKGSTVIGRYDSSNKLGFNRFPLSWQRIITPQGHNIILTDGASADIKGYSGVIGVPDDRYWERYGIPLSLSTISNSILLMVSQMGEQDNNNQQIILDNSRQDLSYIMKNIINEQIKIQPKIIVQAGSRLFLNLEADIFFPIPKKGELQVQYFNKLIQKGE